MYAPQIQGYGIGTAAQVVSFFTRFRSAPTLLRAEVASNLELPWNPPWPVKASEKLEYCMTSVLDGPVALGTKAGPVRSDSMHTLTYAKNHLVGLD